MINNSAYSLLLGRSVGTAYLLLNTLQNCNISQIEDVVTKWNQSLIKIHARRFLNFISQADLNIPKC